MSNQTPKNDDDGGGVIIIGPKSAFRKAIERGLESPAVWLVAILILVFVGAVFGK